MIRAVRSLPALLSTAFLLAFAAGCQSSSDIGKPCDKAEQCAEGQICDFHDGKGTCQEPHGHGSAGETHSTDDHATDTHSTDTHSTDDHHASTGDDPTTEHGETEHTSTAGTTDTSTG
ncbi:hypothetical protein [Nannocystis radixulma]|uniref:Lipoprotein n=1 Tax=Nannocystis radixulma TaxID=2995305 RepID=A0ABT5B639_9BACT|nr:hypothetical protein [Nannocystis radixulma]MDC0669557.1 hypothetical protein [Nannocystis radixulma]